VQVEALIPVAAVPVANKKVALGHLAQVVLVQELTRLAFLAERAEPVLAYQRAKPAAAAAAAASSSLGVFAVVGIGGGREEGVALGTVGFKWAGAGLVGFADWAVGGEGVLVGFLQEGCEGEGVGWVSSGKEVGGHGVGPCWRGRCGRRHG